MEGEEGGEGREMELELGKGTRDREVRCVRTGRQEDRQIGSSEKKRRQGRRVTKGDEVALRSRCHSVSVDLNIGNIPHTFTSMPTPTPMPMLVPSSSFTIDRA